MLKQEPQDDTTLHPPFTNYSHAKKSNQQLFVTQLQLISFETMDENQQTNQLLSILHHLNIVPHEDIYQNPRMKNIINNFAQNLLQQTIGIRNTNKTMGNAYLNNFNLKPTTILSNENCRMTKSSKFYFKTVHLLAIKALMKLIDFSFITWSTILNQLNFIVENHQSNSVKAKTLYLMTTLMSKNHIGLAMMSSFVNVATQLINYTKNSTKFSHAIEFLGQLYLTIHSTKTSTVANKEDTLVSWPEDFPLINGVNISSVASAKGFATKVTTDEINHLCGRYIFLQDGTIFLNLLVNYLRNNTSSIVCSVLDVIIKIVVMEQPEIDFKTYLIFCELLEHDDESVRLLGIDLSLIMAHYTGSTQIKSMSNYDNDFNSKMNVLYLADDIFINLCGVIRCDNSTKIQHKALISLKNIFPITSQCMEECVIKELVSNHNTKKSFHQQQRERYGMIFDGVSPNQSTILIDPISTSSDDDEDTNNGNNQYIVMTSTSSSIEKNKTRIVVKHNNREHSHNTIDNNSFDISDDPGKNDSYSRSSRRDKIFANKQSTYSSSVKRRTHVGTFVDVLEVEFQQIRTTAIDTLYSLAARIDKSNTKTSTFLSNACDLLISSINDSVPNVRFEAIQKLTALMTNNNHENMCSQNSDPKTNQLNDKDILNDNNQKKLPKLSSNDEFKLPIRKEILGNFISLGIIENNLENTNRLELSDHQLYAALEALSDVSSEIRNQVYYLLQNSTLSSTLSLYSVMSVLKNNIVNYPNDKWNIWKCCQQFGLRHGHYVMGMIHSLLGIHPFFINPQPLLSDNVYVALAILMFNAAYTYPPMVTLLPKYCEKHHSFLRNMYRDLVPNVVFSEAANASHNSLDPKVFLSVTDNPDKLHQEMIANFKHLFNFHVKNLGSHLNNNNSKNDFIAIDDSDNSNDITVNEGDDYDDGLIAELEYYVTNLNICKTNISKNKLSFDSSSGGISHKIKFHMEFIGLLTQFSCYIQQSIESYTVHNYYNNSTLGSMLITKSVTLYSKVKSFLHLNTFNNSQIYPYQLILMVMEYYLGVAILYGLLLVYYNCNTDAIRTHDIIKVYVRTFLSNIGMLGCHSVELAAIIKRLALQQESFIDSNFNEDSFEIGEKETLTKLHQYLNWSSWINLIANIPIRFVDEYEYSTARIISPYQSDKHINKFQSIGHLLIPFHGVVFNYKSFNDNQFFILTKFPNNSYTLYRPSDSELKCQNDRHLNIVCDLRLSCFPWSDAGTVTLVCTIKVNAGIFKLLPQCLIDALFSLHCNYNEVFLLSNGLVQLCEPTALKVYPFL